MAWDINQITGWQVCLPPQAEAQPVETAAERACSLIGTVSEAIGCNRVPLGKADLRAASYGVTTVK